MFTVGDGTQIQKVAIEALRRFVLGRDLNDFTEEPGLLAQALTEHHQLRWLVLGTHIGWRSAASSTRCGIYGQKARPFQCGGC